MLVKDFISYLNIIGTAPGDETDLVIADPEQERPESIFNGRCFFYVALADPGQILNKMVDLSIPGTHKTRKFSERLKVLGEENCADLDDLRLMGEGAAEDALDRTHFKIDDNVRTHKGSFLCVSTMYIRTSGREDSGRKAVGKYFRQNRYMDFFVILLIMPVPLSA